MLTLSRQLEIMGFQISLAQIGNQSNQLSEAGKQYRRIFGVVNPDIQMVADSGQCRAVFADGWDVVTLAPTAQQLSGFTGRVMLAVQNSLASHQPVLTEFRMSAKTDWYVIAGPVAGAVAFTFAGSFIPLSRGWGWVILLVVIGLMLSLGPMIGKRL